MFTVAHSFPFVRHFFIILIIMISSCIPPKKIIYSKEKMYAALLLVWQNVDPSIPMVEAVNPENEANDVDIDEQITIQFSKTMDSSTINDNTLLIKEGENTILGEIVVNNNQAVFTPSSLFQYNTRYTLSLGKEIKDQRGNALSEAYAHDFTTKSIISSSSPASSSTNVSPNTDTISLTFLEGIAESTLLDKARLQPGSIPLEYVSYDSGTKTVVYKISQKPLQENVTYHIHIASGLMDINGNLSGEDTNYSFSTGTLPNNILATNPARGSTGVSVNESQISIIFSNNVDASSLPSQMFLEPDSIKLDFVSYNSGTKTAVYQNTNLPMGSSMTYSLQIPSGIKDVDGNYYGANNTHSFTTGHLESFVSKANVISPQGDTYVVQAGSDPPDPSGLPSILEPGTFARVNNQVFMFGLMANIGNASSMTIVVNPKVYIYNLDTNAWSVKGNISWKLSGGFTDNFYRSYATYDQVTNSVYLIGGMKVTTRYINENARYDLTNSTWALKNPLEYGGNDDGAGVAPVRAIQYKGKIRVLGGGMVGLTDDNNIYYYNLQEQREYDPVLNTWTVIGSENIDGFVVSVRDRFYTVDHDNHVYLYNPETNKLSLVGTIPDSRKKFCLSSSGNDMYFMGGVLSGSYLQSVKVFNTLTNTWSNGVDMPKPMRCIVPKQAIPYKNKIFLMGGSDSTGTLVDVYAFQ